MSEQSFENGRYTFGMSYRRFRGDEGLSLRLLGPVNDERRELLRYDCFQKTPHYHTAVYDANVITSIDKADPVQWSLDQIGDGLSELAKASGADAPLEIEIASHAGVVDRIRIEAAKLVAAETATTS